MSVKLPSILKILFTLSIYRVFPKGEIQPCLHECLAEKEWEGRWGQEEEASGILFYKTLACVLNIILTQMPLTEDKDRLPSSLHICQHLGSPGSVRRAVPTLVCRHCMCPVGQSTFAQLLQLHTLLGPIILGQKGPP